MEIKKLSKGVAIHDVDDMPDVVRDYLLNKFSTFFNKMNNDNPLDISINETIISGGHPEFPKYPTREKYKMKQAYSIDGVIHSNGIDGVSIILRAAVQKYCEPI